VAHKGTSTFIIQRASAALLIPLAIWFLVGVVSHLGADQASARAWLSAPLNAGLLALFVSVGAWHMRIGMEEIIADYIHGGLKGVLSIINWLAALSLIAGALWSIYNIAFTG